MDEQNLRISSLIIQSIHGVLTEAEREELEAWQAQADEHRELLNRFSDPEYIEQELRLIALEDTEQALQRDLIRIQGESTRTNIFSFSRYLSAAAVLLFFSLAGFYWYAAKKQSQPSPRSYSGRFRNDVAPGSSKAVLTLADGSTLPLESRKNGLVAEQGGISILQLTGGRLAYQEGRNRGEAIAAETMFNTVTTPRGGQFQIQLPDGSVVWLNAASSVRYPTTFKEPERTITITGEAFIEVKPDGSKPFRVETGMGTTINVLGTGFNISAYPDEAAQLITVQTGSVKVNRPGDSRVLRAGEQAQVKTQSKSIQIAGGADMASVLAWKDGLFRFNGASIQTIMHQVARWYDVEVTYQDTAQESFVATISRDEPISELLRLLELTGAVHFTIEGRRVTVTR